MGLSVFVKTNDICMVAEKEWVKFVSLEYEDTIVYDEWMNELSYKTINQKVEVRLGGQNVDYSSNMNTIRTLKDNSSKSRSMQVSHNPWKSDNGWKLFSRLMMIIQLFRKKVEK